MTSDATGPVVLSGSRVRPRAGPVSLRACPCSATIRAPGYGLTSDLDFADSLIAFRPESHIDERFANTPLLIAHGGENDLHPVTEARSLYATYPGPKTLFLLPGGGHTEWMQDEDAKFKTFAGRISDWLEQTV